MRPEWLANLWLRMKALARREKLDRDLDDELQFHLAMREKKLLEAGATPEEARNAARQRFGNTTLTKERSRDMWSFVALETFWQDVRFGLRMLRKSPAFTAVAVLTLALGMGANTAIFSLIDAVMLRLLPVRDAQQLVILRWTAREEPKMTGVSWPGCPGQESHSVVGKHMSCSFSYPAYEQIRSVQGVFSAISGFAGPVRFRATVGGKLSFAKSVFASGDFFSTLGLRPELGRLLEPSDDEPGAEPAVLLGYSYWIRQFDGDPSVIGKGIILEGDPFTIAGVATNGFTGLDPGVLVDMWLPLSSAPRVLPGWGFKSTDAASRWVEMVARIKPGTSLAQAESMLSGTFAATALHGPEPVFKVDDAPRIELPSIARGLATLRFNFSQPLFLLMAGVGLVLLLTCTNLAGLVLARSAARQKETALRHALGASRARLICQHLTESFLIAIAGGLLGAFFAYWGARSLAAFLAVNWVLPVQIDVRPDPWILGFTAVVAVLATLLFGLAPALRGARVDLTPILKGSGSMRSSGPPQLRLGSGLVFAQVALSVVVLAGTGLLVRTLANLESVKLGFDPRNVLLVDVDTATNLSQADPRIQTTILRDLQTRFAALPGVLSVSRSLFPLLSRSTMRTIIHLAGAPAESNVEGNELPVTPGFLETMRIPLLAGRTLTTTDLRSDAAPEPAVINQALAHKLFRSRNPLGGLLSEFGSRSPDYQVVGVVGDAKYGDLRSPIEPTIYEPVRRGGGSFELRTAGDPKGLITSVRQALDTFGGVVLVENIRTQEDQIEKTLYRERLFADVSGLFGFLALGLVCIGVYGLLSYQVARRTQEIGIRVALGAQARDVLRLVVWKGIVLVLAGTAVGIGVSAGVTRYLRSLLYNVTPTDPMTFVGVALALTLVALAACYIPARRATRVDPMVALRYE